MMNQIKIRFTALIKITFTRTPGFLIKQRQKSSPLKAMKSDYIQVKQ